MPSFCPYYNRQQCRSCSWIEEDYASQITRKERVIGAALSFFGPFSLEKSTLSPLQGFRNRAKMIVTGSVTQPIIGLAGEENLDEGRELLSCPIHVHRLNELIATIPGMIRRYHLIPYQIQERKGELKGLIAYYSPLSAQMYLRFILRSRECVARIKKLMPSLQESFPDLACISANIQPIPHAILEGPEEIILTGQNFIDHQIGPIRLKLAPQAFVQTNFQVSSALYQTASAWIKEASPGKVLELFCGQGAFSFFAAQNASEILGLEINPHAVTIANETARHLGLTHLRFQCSDATQIRENIEKFDPNLILANPPRRGLGNSIELILKHLPQDFLYSSCSIQSLASDLGKLAKNYRLMKVQLFDMFPHTEHFETLAWLKRR